MHHFRRFKSPPVRSKLNCFIKNGIHHHHSLCQPPWYPWVTESSITSPLRYQWEWCLYETWTELVENEENYCVSENFIKQWPFCQLSWKLWVAESPYWNSQRYPLELCMHEISRKSVGNEESYCMSKIFIKQLPLCQPSWKLWLADSSTSKSSEISMRLMHAWNLKEINWERIK